VPPLLTTTRLALRPAGPGDVDGLHALLVQPAVRQYLCDDKVLPREMVAEFVADDPGPGLGMWVVEHAGQLAGLASLKPVAEVLCDLVPALRGEVEPTVALAPALWGQGYASEVLGAVLAHGFGTLALPRIAAVCDVPNARSAAMLARAGFRRTGEHQGVFYRIATWTLDAP
jgi:ribosomal-protein-alanine N-acetyltransferase